MAMLRIHVDHERCQGHGLCNGVDESAFPLDELGYSMIHDATTNAEPDLIDRAVRLCPERAITYTTTNGPM
jgi:ferredoxin